MQQPHWNGRALQCGEEEDWELLLDADLLISVQVSSVRWLVRDTDGSQGMFSVRVPCGGNG